MKIMDSSMFFNEHLIADIKLEENAQWLDETHITEANLTFRNQAKDYVFSGNNTKSRILHHQFNAEEVFKSGLWNRSLGPWHWNKRNCHWYNEAMQRNACMNNIIFSDEDIIIMSDVDEIIDRRFSQIIIEEVTRRGAISIKLHVTQYCFDLFADTWPGPPEYAYRVFIMMGWYFRKIGISPDQLRKMGESGQLCNSIYCLPEPAGFHYSWIGNWRDLLYKINSYSHDSWEHSHRLINAKGEVDTFSLIDAIKTRDSLFEHCNLISRPDIGHLQALEAFKERIEPFIAFPDC